MEQKSKIVLLLAFFISIVFIFFGVHLYETIKQEAQSNDQSVIVSNDLVLKNDELVSAKESVPSPMMTVTVDDVPLPQDVNVQTLTLGENVDVESENQIVVPDQLIDAIIDEQEIGGDGKLAAFDYEHALVESLTEPTLAIKTKPLVTAISNEQLRSDAVILTTINPNHYALQLAVMPSFEKAFDFIEHHQAIDFALIYQTEHEQKSAFIVVTGNYASTTQANQAKMQLSKELQVLKPWPKSYRIIQQEIDRLK